MPLFDFFKKPDKKETPKENKLQHGEQTKKDTLLSPEMQKKRYDAAIDFLKFFQGKTPLLNGKPHAGTVLSIGSRLAGTSLYRSINKKDFASGAVVLSEEVNRAYPQLLNLYAYYCKQNGIDVMAKPLIQEIPEQDKPLLDLAQVQTEYQQEYNLIMKKHGLDYLESARAGMVVCSIFFNYHCINSKDIDPYVATGIVAMGVVEGAKTSPVPLKSDGAGEAKKNAAKSDEAENFIKTIASSSISGSGGRLVLGEQDAVMQEALKNGGKYILVHPEVANRLQQGGLNPYIIYITALITEIEAKIPQIDFVNVDVEKLVQKWNGQPKEQVPVYVKLMLWLKENAEMYGYQQSGNSWKLE